MCSLSEVPAPYSLQLRTGLSGLLDHVGPGIGKPGAQGREGAHIFQLPQGDGREPTDISVCIAERGEQRLDGASISQLAQGDGCTSTDPPLCIAEHGEQRLDGARIS